MVERRLPPPSDDGGILPIGQPVKEMDIGRVGLDVDVKLHPHGRAKRMPMHPGAFWLAIRTDPRAIGGELGGLGMVKPVFIRDEATKCASWALAADLDVAGGHTTRDGNADCLANLGSP